MGAQQTFYQALEALGEAVAEPLPVTLSPELIGLLSEQLYRSPSKAIEELVINGFDAEADEARVFVPEPGDEAGFIAVYDDGIGMTYEGIADLWKVGRPKLRDESLIERKNRRQIGKFGIGKLSTYAIANRVTYITFTNGQLLGVTIDYRHFVTNPNSTATAVELKVRQFASLSELSANAILRLGIDQLGLTVEALDSRRSWTIVILEDVKEKANRMGLGRLRWVLRTAMPLSSRFKIFLNGEQITSSLEDLTIAVDFKLADLPQSRLNTLAKKTGQRWWVQEDHLISESFPLGISGTVIVTRETLVRKSAEVMRSEGFFVYVRGRLVNEEDARFGLHELSHATLNRFRAMIYADDLDRVVTANRESMADTTLYRDAQTVLNEVFNEARFRYENYEEQRQQQTSRAPEEKRNWVPEQLVEYPTADALTDYAQDNRGSEPDESWMYLNVGPDTDLEDLASKLYSTLDRDRRYTYQYSDLRDSDRLVQFDPELATFRINANHDMALAYSNDPTAERLLHDFVTGEALLEVYLRESGAGPHAIGEILEKRDRLFRGLANAHMFSLAALGRFIRDSANNSHDLEVAVVSGARALGFVAMHLGNSGEPDGIARFMDFPEGEQKIILEAKSSENVPPAKDIDFAAIRTHMDRHNASGCLLLAPGYQGDQDSNSARAAKQQGISCWTVRRFADVIEAAEARQISAREVLDIVRTRFAPHDVDESVMEILAEPTWERRALYLAVVSALRNLRGILSRSPRNVSMIATEIARMEGFGEVEEPDIRRAILDLAGSSQGSVLLRDNDDVLVLNVDYDELERRVQALTGESGSPRRMGAFGQMAT